MHYEILSSNSKANTIIVDDILCLDIGVTYKKIKPYLNKIKLIFISHVHSLRPLKSYNNKTTFI